VGNHGQSILGFISEKLTCLLLTAPKSNLSKIISKSIFELAGRDVKIQVCFSEMLTLIQDW